MYVLTTRVHPTVTAARRRARWHAHLSATVALLVMLLLALPILTAS